MDGGTLRDMYSIIQKQKNQLEQLKKPPKRTTSSSNVNSNNSDKFPFTHPSIIYELNRYALMNKTTMKPKKLEETINKFKSNQIISIDVNKLSYENFHPHFQLFELNLNVTNEISSQRTKISFLNKTKWKPLNFFNDLNSIYNNLQNTTENNGTTESITSKKRKYENFHISSIDLIDD